MTGLIDLETEMWRSIENVRQPHIDRLIALGVSGRALAGLGCVQPPFGVARIRRLSDGLYEPDSDGDPSVIVPVYEPTDLGLLGLVDLIAWATRDPACWSWRIGQAWALRDDLLDGDLPMSVVETPLDWIKAAGDAMCILDWSAPAQCWARLRSGPSLQFSNEGLRQKTHSALVATATMPIMEISDAA